MTLRDLVLTLACYSTKPGDLVLVHAPADARPEELRLVGKGLEAWAIARQVTVTIVNGPLEIEILDDANLASMGLQRIPE